MNTTKSIIEAELLKRILVLDGAMGTMLQQYNFSEEDFSNFLKKVSSVINKNKR